MEVKIKKISEWIQEQGYPLEMYCENVLSHRGFSVMQSLHYEDAETKKFREIDILATKFRLVNGVTFNFSIVIECKLSKDKPWLLFTRKPHRNHNDDLLDNVFSTNNGKLITRRSFCFKNFSLVSYNGERIGFNATQCFTNGKDVPYQALMSTISACEYLVKKSNESTRQFCNFYFPVIVADCELYECSGMPGGDLAIQPIEIGKLISVRSYSERSTILHTVVTKKGFESFINFLSLELDTLLEKMTHDFQYVSENHPSNYNPIHFM